MWYDNLFKELEDLKDEAQANKMSAYMQNKFPFLGIPKPKLMDFIKPYLKISRNYDFSWNFVFECYKKDYREAQYIAIEYLNKNIKNIKIEDLDKLKTLIITKSWWETVDSLDSMVGELILKDNSLEKTMLLWSKEENIWLRRVSIDYSQRYKEKTNISLLEQIIINNLGSKEFFINKAIGWSLREYSKTNNVWVKDFIDKYKDKLDKLSIKEASKYLKD